MSIAKISDTIFEDTLFTTIYLNNVNNILVVSNTYFNNCHSSNNGSSIHASSCFGVTINNVYSINCSANNIGQFCYVDIDLKKYNFNASFISAIKTQTTGRSSIYVDCQKFLVAHSNFSSNTCDALFSDETGDGCYYKFLNIENNSGDFISMVSTQEIRYSGLNNLSYINYINNYWSNVKTYGHILLVNSKNVLEYMNICSNSGTGYLIFCHRDVQATIKNCHIQDTYPDGEAIISPSTSISSMSLIEFQINNTHDEKCLNVIKNRCSDISEPCKGGSFGKLKCCILSALLLYYA